MKHRIFRRGKNTTRSVPVALDLSTNLPYKFKTGDIIALTFQGAEPVTATNAGSQRIFPVITGNVNNNGDYIDPAPLNSDFTVVVCLGYDYEFIKPIDINNVPTLHDYCTLNAATGLITSDLSVTAGYATYYRLSGKDINNGDDTVIVQAIAPFKM